MTSNGAVSDSGQSGAEGSQTQAFFDSVAAMLAKPEYLLPLAAAEHQFRHHYYGLNAASLLEDLFSDALGHFVRLDRPADSFQRASTGQKAWDYSYNGARISHKVGLKTGAIAAVWDATKKTTKTWTSQNSIVYALGSTQPRTAMELTLADKTRLRVSPISQHNKSDLRGRALLVIRWAPDSNEVQILECETATAGMSASQALPFEKLWRIVNDPRWSAVPINHIEVLVTTTKPKPAVISKFVGSSGEVRAELSNTQGLDVHRSGVYLLTTDVLSNIPVTRNNRAILIPKTKVIDLLKKAASDGAFCPLPQWYTIYTEERPPDLYITQRAEFDMRFSASQIARLQPMA